MDRVLRELRAASKLEPLDAEIFVADGDFLDVPRCSPERLALTGVVLPTQTMLRRKLIRLKAKKGRQAGVELFNTQLNQPRDADPEVSIDLEMEKQKADYFKVLYQKDLEFTNHTTDPPQPLLEPVGWIPPSGHRMMEQPTLGSGYSGLNPLAEAARVAGLGVTKFDAESHPRLRKHLENLNPEALHFADVAQLMGPDTPGTVQLLQLSPTCIAFADPNRYGKGRDDSEFGGAYEQCGHIVEHIKPLRALIECTRGVLRRSGGGPSAVDLLKKNSPSYYIQVLADVDAGKVRSSLSNEKAKLKHHRCWVVLDRKDCFDKAPKWRYTTKIQIRSLSQSYTSQVRHQAICACQTQIRGTWISLQPIRRRKGLHMSRRYFSPLRPVEDTTTSYLKWYPHEWGDAPLGRQQEPVSGFYGR